MEMQLYHYEKEKDEEKDKEHKRLLEAINWKVEEFTKKFGYRPDGVQVRKDEVNGNFDYDGMQIQIVERGCQPSHFFLYPVVKKRTPRVLEKERKPYV